MKDLKFYIVDVFAEKKYSGNQLAVFTNANKLSSERMQQIAREINFSETSFITAMDHKKSIYDVRIFTPEHEVPFAGHPTLGTAFVIRKMLTDGLEEKITLSQKVGEIPVTCTQNQDGKTIYWMKQTIPVFNKKIPVEEMSKVLGLDPDDFDENYPIEEVSTGLPHIIVPLRTLKALGDIKISKEKYYALINRTTAKNILVFCPQAHSGMKGFSTRMFADYLGIPEDPATGSGNGCLGAYLIKYRYMGKERISIRSEQGYEMGRPSVLYVEAEKKNKQIHISVGGEVIEIAEGRML